MDITFMEQESYFLGSYLQGETLMEDKEDLSFLNPPITSPTSIIDTTKSQPINSNPLIAPMSKSNGAIQKKISPSFTPSLQVYLRWKLPIPEPMQVQKNWSYDND